MINVATAPRDLVVSTGGAGPTGRAPRDGREIYGACISLVIYKRQAQPPAHFGRTNLGRKREL